MNTLTVAELRLYPGRTFTEQLKSHHDERLPVSPAPAAPAAKSLARTGLTVTDARPLERTAHGALPVGRRIDVRRFTGRDRLDRIVNYLRASVPRTAQWSEESLRDLAARLTTTTEIVE